MDGCELTVSDLKSMHPTEVDVLIIGAGISGIGAAYQLQKRCPQQTYGDGSDIKNLDELPEGTAVVGVPE